MNYKFELCVAAMMVVLTSGNVHAQLPPDRTVQYIVRVIPTDPSSDILFTMTLNLGADQISGNDVAWEIVSVEFDKPNAGGGSDIWTGDYPFVNTNDGLWWIQHADPTNPVQAEFDIPPALIDTAIANDPNNGNLIFDVSSSE